MNKELYQRCIEHASKLILSGLTIGDLNNKELADLLYKLEEEKKEKEAFSDSLLDYDDEIVSIEPVGDLETIDITVTGDNLFYCNDILTKNSIGLPNILDLFLAIIRTEELDENNEILFKQLKNRYRDENLSRTFTCGCNKGKMKLWDSTNSEYQQNASRTSIAEEEFGAPKGVGKKRPASFNQFTFDSEESPF